MGGLGLGVQTSVTGRGVDVCAPAGTSEARLVEVEKAKYFEVTLECLLKTPTYPSSTTPAWWTSLHSSTVCVGSVLQAYQRLKDERDFSDRHDQVHCQLPSPPCSDHPRTPHTPPSPPQPTRCHTS